jgi:hypothetical protein
LDDEGVCELGGERKGGEAEKGSAALATGISRCGTYPHAGAWQGPRRWGRRVGRIFGHLGSALRHRRRGEEGGADQMGRRARWGGTSGTCHRRRG